MATATLSRHEANALVEAQHRRNIVRTTNWSTRMVQFFYSQIAVGDLDESFFLMLPQMTAMMTWGKRQAALESWSYLSQKAVVNGVPFGQAELRSPQFDVEKAMSPRALATPGYDVTPFMAGADRAASGQQLILLNKRAPGGVKALIKQGVPPEDAIATSMKRAAALIRTEIPLVARTVPAMAAESPSVQGYRRWRRVPGPGACGFCLVLASRGAVYRDPVTAGGQYHANCRCSVQAEVNPKMVDSVAIDPEDLRAIRVKFANTGQVWQTDLGNQWYDYQNRPDTRPPASEFLPLKAAK